MADVKWDTSDFENGIRKLTVSVGIKTKQALQDIANEVLHLSQFEVPHDTGNLQNSGQIDQEAENDIIVGYNTVYAAYQHEGARADGSHVIHNYQAGRKGKYLEDPIRNNLDKFKNYYSGIINE